MSRLGSVHLQQPSKFVRPVCFVFFIVVDVEAGRPCTHQAPGFADRLRWGRKLEFHGSAAEKLGKVIRAANIKPE